MTSPQKFGVRPGLKSVRVAPLRFGLTEATSNAGAGCAGAAPWAEPTTAPRARSKKQEAIERMSPLFHLRAILIGPWSPVKKRLQINNQGSGLCQHSNVQRGWAHNLALAEERGPSAVSQSTSRLDERAHPPFESVWPSMSASTNVCVVAFERSPRHPRRSRLRGPEDPNGEGATRWSRACADHRRRRERRGRPPSEVVKPIADVAAMACP